MNNVRQEHPSEPGGRDPAPGDLRTVQLFVNSLDIEQGSDSFDQPEVVSRWLCDTALTSEPNTVSSHADLRRVIELREALRGLLVSNHEGVAPGRDAEVLAATASAGDLSTEVDQMGNVQVIATAPGLDGALARIVLIAAEACATGHWARLKVCSNDECRWAFWDSSRNRSGRWCSMSICGNQAKVRAHRKRTAGHRPSL